MGLIACIAGGIAVAAAAAAKLYAWLRDRQMEEHVGDQLNRSTAIVINVASSIRAVWEAMTLLGGLVPSSPRAVTVGGGSPLRRRRVWDRTADEMEAVGAL